MLSCLPVYLDKKEENQPVAPSTAAEGGKMVRFSVALFVQVPLYSVNVACV